MRGEPEKTGPGEHCEWLLKGGVALVRPAGVLIGWSIYSGGGTTKNGHKSSQVWGTMGGGRDFMGKFSEKLEKGHGGCSKLQGQKDNFPRT